MSKSKEEPQNVKETITEAIVLLAGLAQKTLRQELEKIQSSPNPPFFLKLKLGLRGKENDEDYQNDIIELQNFADVLAETMAHLLKRAEQSLLEEMKKTQNTNIKNIDKIDLHKQRENEVRNFTKIFAEARSNLMEEVKNLIKEFRKDEEEEPPKRSESIFSILGIEETLPKPKSMKRPLTSGYDTNRKPPKKPRIISPQTKLPAKKKGPASEEDKYYICDGFGHWAYQCTKPDNRMCYICNKKGHISTQCTEPENRHCYICNKKGHIAVECIKASKRDCERGRKHRSRSYSRGSPGSWDS